MGEPFYDLALHCTQSIESIHRRLRTQLELLSLQFMTIDEETFVVGVILEKLVQRAPSRIFNSCFILYPTQRGNVGY